MVRRRWLVLVLALFFLVCMASFLPHMRLENASQSYLHDDNPASIRYEAFCDQFGQDDQILVAITPPDVFDPRFLESLRDLHAELEEELPYVTEVNSLVNARRTRGEDDMLIVEDLLDDWPATPEAFAALRARVLSNPLYIDTLISRDGRTTTITIEPDLYATDDVEDPLADLSGGFDTEATTDRSSRPDYLSTESKRELLAALDPILERASQPGVEIQFSGGPVVERHLNSMMISDIRAYMGASGLAIALFLYGLFRRVTGVLLPAVVVAASLVSTLGTMVWLDMPFSLVLGMLPIFTMTVGVCTTVHVLVAAYREIGSGCSREDALAGALRHSGLAIAMASATTAAGLSSFTTAELEPIRNLGVIAPLAVGYAFVFTMTLLPALMSIIPLRRKVWGGRRAAVSVSERLLVWTGAMAVRHARGVLVWSFVLLVFLAAGAARLEFAHQPLAWFPEGDPTRDAIETVDRVMRGSTNVEVVIDTGRENGLHEPDVLRQIEAAMEMAEGLTVGSIFIGKALSLVDIVKESHEALNGSDPEARVIPDSRPVVSQELLLFENGGSDDLENFSDSQFRVARLSLRLPESDAVVYQRFLAELRVGLGATLGGLDYEVTGRTVLAARSMSALITSMGSSYLVALLVITPLMILMIGDLRLGLISMVPNLFPVIFVLGAMGWLSLPLDASNILIGSVIIGLAVDDTIHFLQRFRREFEEAGDIEEAVRRTMRVTGSALFFTSLVLSTGFLVMALRGTMLNTIQFGALSAAGISFAFIADVIVTPALITRARGLLPTASARPADVSGPATEQGSIG
jgi:hypothetical protein